MAGDGLFGLAPAYVWLILAGVLAATEVVAPGVFLIWIGAAALVTGLLALVLPIPVPAQFLVFAVAALASIYIGRRVLRDNPIDTTDPMLNDRAARMIGTIVTAVEPVDADQGRVRVGDGVWSARGAVAGVGERLRVTGIDNGVLIVERA